MDEDYYSFYRFNLKTNFSTRFDELFLRLRRNKDNNSIEYILFSLLNKDNIENSLKLTKISKSIFYHTEIISHSFLISVFDYQATYLPTFGHFNLVYFVDHFLLFIHLNNIHSCLILIKFNILLWSQKFFKIFKVLK